MTPGQEYALLRGDIESIPTARALRIWAQRWADDLRRSPYVDELREMYQARLKELEVDDGHRNK